MQAAPRNGALAPTNVYPPANRLGSWLDRLLIDSPFAGMAAEPELAMPLSMWDDEDNVYVEMDAPGVQNKDVEIRVEEGAVLIRGERKSAHQGGRFDTRSYGRFEHRLRIPIRLDADKVEARLANGVLSITLPKSVDAKPRKIAVKAE
jgi:HSP20 family protein